MKEGKRLIPVTVRMQDNVWDFFSTEEGFQHFNCKTTPEKMRTAFYRLHIMDGDGEEHCRSSKNNTYMGMLRDIDMKGEVTFSVWRSRYPKNKEEFEALFR